jgi:predicted glycosyltransferase
LSSPRVWVDVITPKQVLFFAPVVKELADRGCEVLATSRRYREVEPMARMCGLNLEYVGERGGEDLQSQLIAATARQLSMIPIVDAFRPSVAVSVASAVCARVAFGLRTRHIAVNDSPHSEVAARLSLPLSYRLLCPWIMPYEAWKKFGLSRLQVGHYRALDPAAWLKRPPLVGPIPRLKPGRKTITIRVEESYAPYMASADRDLTGATLQRLEEAFPDANLVALCRYGDQLEGVRRRFGRKYIVPEEVVDGRRLLASTDLFIGMGGTMSAEAALMGVPTISAYQGVLLTEVYLSSVGLLVKTKDPERIVRQARKLLSGEYKAAMSAKAKRILDFMEDPVPKIAGAIVKAGAQAG